MPPLPVVSGQEVIRAFEREGWEIVRQQGSHIHLGQPGVSVILTVPDHKELDRGLLRSLIRKADLSVEEFIALLRGR